MHGDDAGGDGVDDHMVMIMMTLMMRMTMVMMVMSMMMMMMIDDVHGDEDTDASHLVVSIYIPSRISPKFWLLGPWWVGGSRTCCWCQVPCESQGETQGSSQGLGWTGRWCGHCGAAECG